MISKFRFIQIFVLLALVQPATLKACDFDGDGIDDPAAVETQEDGSWNWRAFLSAGGEKTETGFGNSSDLAQACGYYINASQAEFGIVDNMYYWQIPGADCGTLTDCINFGDTNVTYAPGNDLNGDGIDDLLKFLFRCNSLTRSCYRKRVRGNIFYNNSDGTNTFINDGINTATGLFAKGLDPIVIADYDNDSKDDICSLRPLKTRPKVFRLTCQNVAGERVGSRRLARVFSKPLALKRAGEIDFIVLYKQQKRKGDTKFWVFPRTGSPYRSTMPAIGEVIVGDWAGSGSQQIGVVDQGVLTYFDPVSGVGTSTAVPNGTPVDCYNNLSGDGESTILTSRNICKILDC